MRILRSVRIVFLKVAMLRLKLIFIGRRRLEKHVPEYIWVSCLRTFRSPRVVKMWNMCVISTSLHNEKMNEFLDLAHCCLHKPFNRFYLIQDVEAFESKLEILNSLRTKKREFFCRLLQCNALLIRKLDVRCYMQ